MKKEKILALLAFGSMVLTLVACGGYDSSGDSDSTEDISQESSENSSSYGSSYGSSGSSSSFSSSSNSNSYDSSGSSSSSYGSSGYGSSYSSDSSNIVTGSGAGGYDMPNENDESFSDYVQRVDPDLYNDMTENYESLFD